MIVPPVIFVSRTFFLFSRAGALPSPNTHIRDDSFPESLNRPLTSLLI